MVCNAGLEQGACHAGLRQDEQLQGELQQRSGQVRKLTADLEYTQRELDELQRHCSSLEVRCRCCCSTDCSVAGCEQRMLH